MKKVPRRVIRPAHQDFVDYRTMNYEKLEAGHQNSEPKPGSKYTTCEIISEIVYFVLLSAFLMVMYWNLTSINKVGLSIEENTAAIKQYMQNEQN